MTGFLAPDSEINCNRMCAHEESLIKAFIYPARRKRWLEHLASPKKRTRFLDRLNHCRDIDDRFSSLLPSGANIVALLSKRGAPPICYVISDYAEIDGREMTLEEAIRAAELGGWGTLIGCVPGRLAYYYDESGERRMLLERND